MKSFRLETFREARHDARLSRDQQSSPSRVTNGPSSTMSEPNHPHSHRSRPPALFVRSALGRLLRTSSCSPRDGGHLFVLVKPSPLRIESTESPGETFDCAICSGPMTDPAVGGGCAHHCVFKF